MPSTKKKSIALPWVVTRQRAHEGQDYAFYNSAAWRRTSAAIRQQRPVCEVCRTYARHQPAQMVDHIIPIRQNGARFHDDNLMSLCHECHNRKSAKDRNQGGLCKETKEVNSTGMEAQLVPAVSRQAIIKLIEEK